MRALWRKRHRRTSKSWRMDETYIKIKGQWNYLYRAIDDQGLTLDFQLHKKRDFNSAYRFLKRLLKTYGLPHRLVTDQYGATLKAIKKLTREGICTKVCISAPNIAIIWLSKITVLLSGNKFVPQVIRALGQQLGHYTALKPCMRYTKKAERS